MGEEKKVQAKANQELTREQLKNACDQLQQQNKFLLEQIQKQNEIGFYKRLDYLFEVTKNASLFIELDKDFVKRCVAEIVDTITIPVQDNQPNGSSELIASKEV